MYQLVIPKTTAQTYISGTQALNIPDETSGDWHFYTVWFSFSSETVMLYGAGQERNTNDIYGSFGISDKKFIMQQYGLLADTDKVYVANHCRAVLDLIYYCAKKKAMNLVVGSTMDYFDTEEQKMRILKLAKKMLAPKYLSQEGRRTLQSWLQTEEQSVYRGVRYA
jgi:hypothetical protein